MTSFSQPDPSSMRERKEDEDSFCHPADEQMYSFSQPIDPENMLLSQIPCTPGGSSQVWYLRLSYAMTMILCLSPAFLHGTRFCEYKYIYQRYV